MLIFGGVALPFLMVFAFIAILAAHTLFDVFGVQRNRIRETNQRQSAETFGIVTQVNKVLKGKSYDAEYTYMYDVKGVSYKKSKISGGYSPSADAYKGIKVKVCYNPSDPNDSDFYTEKSFKQICGE